MKKEDLDILFKRIKAGSVDYLIVCILFGVILKFTGDLINSCLVCNTLAINKDFLNGKSIGKRIFGIQVQDLSNQIANEWKSSLRNLLVIIPIELFSVLLNPKRRIGDYIAQTQIGIEDSLNIHSIRSELKTYQLNKNMIIGLIWGFANIYGLLILYKQLFKLAGFQ
ncbi:MAG: RDD family protein [Saprospiraceae bacterium]|nr:RDD family protein [Saprospiraceae bacterium]